MKPILANDPPRDPNREVLATAITAHAGAARDLKVAEQASELASERCWNAQSKLDELRNEPPAPSGAFAAAFTAAIVSGDPCTTATLERASVAAGAKLAAAENEVAIWRETRQECQISVRSMDSALAAAKEHVERCARAVVCNAETVKRLADGLEALQAEVIEKRAVLRFIWRKEINGELPGPLKERVERLFWRDLTGLEPTSASAAWASAFEELQSNSEAELPS